MTVAPTGALALGVALVVTTADGRGRMPCASVVSAA